MENTQAIRRAKLAQVLAADPFNGNKADLGRALGYKSGAMVYQWLKGIRPITEDTARAIEKRANRPKGWMDANGSTVASAIKDEAALDAYALIEKALAALVIVGRRKDEIIDAIQLAERDSREARESVIQSIREKVK